MTPARREAVQDRGTDSPRRSKIPTPRLTLQCPHRGRGNEGQHGETGGPLIDARPGEIDDSRNPDPQLGTLTR